MTNIFVVTGKSEVFVAYNKTICHRAPFNGENELGEVMVIARSVAFSYAESFGIVNIRCIKDERIQSQDDMFELLEKKNK